VLTCHKEISAFSCLTGDKTQDILYAVCFYNNIGFGGVFEKRGKKVSRVFGFIIIFSAQCP
jgi:hypothetical protein